MYKKKRRRERGDRISKKLEKNPAGKKIRKSEKGALLRCLLRVKRTEFRKGVKPAKAGLSTVEKSPKARGIILQKGADTLASKTSAPCEDSKSSHLWGEVYQIEGR